MRIYGMDELLIEIYNIRNIESISIYDMVLPKSSKMEVVPAIIVNYDSGKSLNLCSRDKGFDLLVRKVTEVYNDEKNNVLEDSLTDPFRMRSTIKIDERTKRILDSGLLLDVNNLYKFYCDKDGYDASLLFQCDEVNMMIDIIKYHLKEFLSHTDIEVAFDEEFSGYRNNYLLSGKVNGIHKYFPFTFDKLSDNEYKISVGGIVNNSCVDLRIKFSKDNINVSVDIDSLGITSDFNYLVTNEVVKKIESIKKNNLPIYYKNEDLNEVNCDFGNITTFDSDIAVRWFYLPWGSYYGINNSVSEISETERVIQIYSMYLSLSDKCFYKKDFYSRNYKRNNTVSVFGESVTLDELIKDSKCVCLNNKDGIYLIETSFLDVSKCNGYYSEKLADKKFYHLYQASRITDINDLVSVSRSDGVLDNGDILNDALTLKLVRGE